MGVAPKMFNPKWYHPCPGSIHNIYQPIEDEILDVCNYTSHECKLQIDISGTVPVTSWLNTLNGTAINLAVVMYGLLTKLARARWLDIGQVHKHAKKELGQYPATLTEQAWSIKDLLYGIKHQSMICVLAGQSPYPERAR